MNGVNGDRFRAEKSPVEQTLSNATVVFFQAVVLVFASFTDVNVVARIDAFHRSDDFFHRLVGNREGGVHAEHSLDPVLLVRVHRLDEVDVLFDLRIGDRFTVAIGDFHRE